MKFYEINWDEYTTKIYKVSGYESDGNTLKVAGRKLIPMNDILGEGYDNLALQVIIRKFSYDIYKVYKQIGNLWIEAYGYIPPSIELEEFKAAIDEQRELFTAESFLTDMEWRCNEGRHIKVTELYVLTQLNPVEMHVSGEYIINLVKRCLETRKANRERLEREDAEREKRAEEERQRRIEEAEKQYAEEKDKVITGIKNHYVIRNVDCDNGKNVITSMCEDAGIKIPIRTKGFMLDKEKMHSFRYGNDGTITIWGRGNSQKVWNILSQLCNYYK